MTHTGEKKNAYRVLLGKPEGRRLLRRPRCRWNVIKVDLQIIGLWRVWKGSSGSGQESVLDHCEHGSEPLGSMNFREDIV
jgi:hypothetical protein